MQLKIYKRLNLIIITYLIILILFLFIMFKNPALWEKNKFLIIGLLVIFSTIFIFTFRYYESNADKKIINKMVFEGKIALARIDGGNFNRFIKDTKGIKYPIWDLDVTIYNTDGATKKLKMLDKFSSIQTRIPTGFVYITYDETSENSFIVPNLLLGAFDNSTELVKKYEKNIKQIKYLNVYYHKGIVIETYKDTIRKEKELNDNQY